jgi:hypothetical protein
MFSPPTTITALGKNSSPTSEKIAAAEPGSISSYFIPSISIVEAAGIPSAISGISCAIRAVIITICFIFSSLFIVGILYYMLC